MYLLEDVQWQDYPSNVKYYVKINQNSLKPEDNLHKTSVCRRHFCGLAYSHRWMKTQNKIKIPQ